MQDNNTKSAWLETMKVYLPYIVISALSYACSYLYKENVRLNEKSLIEARKQADFWRDAFIRTNNAKTLHYEDAINDYDPGNTVDAERK